MKSWIVCKFGGTSVSTRARWNTIAQITQDHIAAGYKPVIVCSAASKMSDRLKQVAQLAPDNKHRETVELIQQGYLTLANALEVNPSCIAAEQKLLEQLSNGMALLGEASLKTTAKLMALGELMLTRLGHEFLKTQGINSHWFDARDGIVIHAPAGEAQAYCSPSSYPHLREQAQACPGEAIITQGFIASNPDGETLLLGRGGSDSSAAYIAAALDAVRCEIWTDVLGIYTSNPHQIPKARLLNQLNYVEAQEIASVGAKVLHPKCVAPVHEKNIPLHIKNTDLPEHTGTVISQNPAPTDLLIKSIIMKHNVLLISIETVKMWQQVGFLANVFTTFAKHGLSIDLISTSESSITVSIDNNFGQYDTAQIDQLIQALNQFCEARLVGPCSSISLVGSHIQMALHQLGPTFELFEAQPIHLMSLAANNLNLSFVVDSDQAERLTKQLHVLLIEQHPRSYQLGDSWEQTAGKATPPPRYWWHDKQDELLQLMQKEQAQYVYNEATLLQAAHALKSLQAIDQVFYAMKANSQQDVLTTIYQSGLNFECVSLAEIEKVLQLFPAIERRRILFTPNFASRHEYEAALALGVYLTIDSAYPLEQWPKSFANQSIILRVDPGYGAGHHKYVCTGGMDSKFGIPMDQLPALKASLARHNTEIIGLHIHSGSGILTPEIWPKSAAQLLKLLSDFPNVKILNLGGGLGVVEKPGQSALDLDALDASLIPIKKAHPELKLWLEPGRYLVANAGVLLAKVTQVKTKGNTTFIGIATGMNSLMRPSLYGAFHEIVNLSQLDNKPTITANIVGPICESGDTLGYSRRLPQTQEGDVILIANTGAYGYVMGSNYNLRAPAKELFLSD